MARRSTLLWFSSTTESETIVAYWAAMESLVDTDEDLHFLGVCNVKLNTLEEVYSPARTKLTVDKHNFRGASSLIVVPSDSVVSGDRYPKKQR